jgi:tRNA modification GTPase
LAWDRSSAELAAEGRARHRSLVSNTIFALSSGALPAAIAIVRISGVWAEEAAHKLAGALPPPRRASLRRLRAADGMLIDEALVLRFSPPHTATGEPLVELHLHGGRAVVARLIQELAGMPGLREAEPGEFTRRALLNGRLDLTEAEGLGDLLGAETEWQRRAAMESAGGALRHQIEAWRDRLVSLSARAEAAIDYVGDEEETTLDLRSVASEVHDLVAEWKVWLEQPVAELLSNGVRIVLAGPPNSGKSSLFNALLGSEKAIVTPTAGTTRDLIEARLDLGGMPLVLVDTAGLRDSEDEVERIGVARAEQAQADADLLLWLGDPQAAPTHRDVLLVHSRADERSAAPPGSIATSVRGSTGTDELKTQLLTRVRSLLPPPDRTALNRRQRSALQESADALRLPNDGDVLIVAEALRQALAALDRLSGRQSTEDVLDALFGQFCLGK